MRLLRKKTIDEICNNAISSILFYADNFLHGDITYNDFLSVLNKEYYVISKVGGKKHTKFADEALGKKLANLKEEKKETKKDGKSLH